MMQEPSIVLMNKVEVAIAIDRKNPLFCWCESTAQGSDESCHFLHHCRRRRDNKLIQWCEIFRGSEVKRIENPGNPKFARCQKCLDTFGY